MLNTGRHSGYEPNKQLDENEAAEYMDKSKQLKSELEVFNKGFITAASNREEAKRKNCIQRERARRQPC